jgi:6-phosphogluconolactonase
MVHPDQGRDVVVLPTADGAATRAAAEVAWRANRAVAERGSFTIAVSGGRTPQHMLRALAGSDLPWARTTIFQVDERIGPADDPQRNLAGLRAALPAVAQDRVVPMPVEAQDLPRACADYARRLPEVFDVVHLGLGADGHTASLIPGDPVLRVTEWDVALTGNYQDRRRMTLTYPRLRRTRAILWLVTGADKRNALQRMLARDRSIPAGSVAATDETVVCDAAARD